MMAFVYVFIGGGLGSLLRYGISILTKGIFSTDFPMGTFIANILACIMLALLVYQFQIRQEGPQWLDQLLVIGFCGGFSTFSTFGNETVELISKGATGIAIANVLLSLITGIGLIFLLRYFKA